MTMQENTSQPSTSERIGEIAFDLNSISTILGFALDKLAASDSYGCTNSEDGEMMCDVGQVLIDTRMRLSKYRDNLHDIEAEIEKQSAGGAA